MATLSLKDFMRKQEQEYKKSATYVKELESTLKYQQNIRMHHTVPRHHRPRPLRIMLPLEANDLNTKFQRQYEDIFFPYLNEVILRNTIALETAKAKLNITHQTESQLCQRTDDPKAIQKAYYQFLEQNEIPTTQISPQLQRIIHAATTKTVTPTTATTIPPKRSAHSTSPCLLTTTTTTLAHDTHKKRKNKSSYPPPKKQPKLDHFLFRKSQSTHPPP